MIYGNPWISHALNLESLDLPKFGDIPICSFCFRLTLGVISLQFGVLALNIAKARDIIYLTGSLTSLVPGSVMCFSGKSKILFLPKSLVLWKHHVYKFNMFNTTFLRWNGRENPEKTFLMGTFDDKFSCRGHRLIGKDTPYIIFFSCLGSWLILSVNGHFLVVSALTWKSVSNWVAVSTIIGVFFFCVLCMFIFGGDIPCLHNQQTEQTEQTEQSKDTDTPRVWNNRLLNTIKYCLIYII